MARPRKAGLEYFSLDIDFMDDAKFVAIIRRHGEKGAFVALRLLAEVYRCGWYVSPDISDLAYKFRVAEEELTEIIATATESRPGGALFDHDTYVAHGVLTSCGTQKQFIEATRKRKGFNRSLDYWLLEDEFPAGFRRGNSEETPDNSTVSDVSAEDCSANAPESTQSIEIVKDSIAKGEKRKE